MTLAQFKDGLADAGIPVPAEGRINGGKSSRFRRTAALEAAGERYVAQDRKLFDLAARSAPDLSPMLERLRAGTAAPELRLVAGG